MKLLSLIAVDGSEAWPFAQRRVHGGRRSNSCKPPALLGIIDAKRSLNICRRVREELHVRILGGLVYRPQQSIEGLVVGGRFNIGRTPPKTPINVTSLSVPMPFLTKCPTRESLWLTLPSALQQYQNPHHIQSIDRRHQLHHHPSSLFSNEH